MIKSSMCQQEVTCPRDQNEAEPMKMVREAEWAASGNTEFPIPGAVQAEIGETIYRRFQN